VELFPHLNELGFHFLSALVDRTLLQALHRVLENNWFMIVGMVPDATARAVRSACQAARASTWALTRDALEPASHQLPWCVEQTR
jgi:hypothetical protein